MCLNNNKNAYRVNSSRKSFSQNHHIWTDFFVVHSQPPAGPCQACLHLISNPQHLDKTQRTLRLPTKSLKHIGFTTVITTAPGLFVACTHSWLLNSVHSCTKLKGIISLFFHCEHRNSRDLEEEISSTGK